MAISGNSITVDTDARYTGRVPTVAPSDGLDGQFDDKVNNAIQVLLNEGLSLTNPNRLDVVRADISGEHDANDIVGSIANPFGANAVVYDVILDVTVVGGTAGDINVGIAADGSTASDTLLDGVSANTVATSNNEEHGGTNGGRLRTMSASQYLNVSVSVATVAGFTGSVVAVIGRL